jgi:hypothetical protein
LFFKSRYDTNIIDVIRFIERTMMNALITADQNLNEGRNKDLIRDVFVCRGILPNQTERTREQSYRLAYLDNGYAGRE